MYNINLVPDQSLIDIIVLIITSILGGIIGGLGGAGGPIIIATLLTIVELPPPLVAGTSSLVFMGGSLVMGSAYIHSGDVDWRIVIIMALPALIGIRFGLYLNQFLSPRSFSIILTLLLTTLSVNILYRGFREMKPVMDLDTSRLHDNAILAIIGFATGVISGSTGFGGSGLIIPLLLILGVPPLLAVGSGIVQGIFITTTTSMSYMMNGNVDFVLALFIGVPFLLAGLLGWRIAHLIDKYRLKIAIGALLFVLTPFIILI